MVLELGAQLREEPAHARGVAAEVVAPVAGGRAHVDARFALVAVDAHDDVVVETDHQRPVDGLDIAGLAAALRRLLRRDRASVGAG